MSLAKKNSIPSVLLKNELTKRKILDNIENNKILSQEEWYFLQQNPNLNIAEKLLNNFLRVYGNSINLLYDKLTENPTQILKLLKINDLFSPKKF